MFDDDATGESRETRRFARDGPGGEAATTLVKVGYVVAGLVCILGGIDGILLMGFSVADAKETAGLITLTVAIGIGGVLLRSVLAEYRDV